MLLLFTGGPRARGPWRYGRRLDAAVIFGRERSVRTCKPMTHFDFFLAADLPLPRRRRRALGVRAAGLAAAALGWLVVWARQSEDIAWKAPNGARTSAASTNCGGLNLHHFFQPILTRRPLHPPPELAGDRPPNSSGGADVILVAGRIRRRTYALALPVRLRLVRGDGADFGLSPRGRFRRAPDRLAPWAVGGCPPPPD